MNRNQDTTTFSSQNSFWMAALASLLSITAQPMYGDEQRISPSIVIIGSCCAFSSTKARPAVYASPRKKNFREGYAKMVQSKWFKETYENKSVGELIEME